MGVMTCFVPAEVLVNDIHLYSYCLTHTIVFTCSVTCRHDVFCFHQQYVHTGISLQDSHKDKGNVEKAINFYGALLVSVVSSCVIVHIYFAPCIASVTPCMCHHRACHRYPLCVIITLFSSTDKHPRGKKEEGS